MKIEPFNLMFKFEKHRMEHIKKLISSNSVRLFIHTQITVEITLYLFYTFHNSNVL